MAVDVPALIAALERGDRRALARLLTVVEDGALADRRAVVAALDPRAGAARVVGITGPPGVGKSTLTSALAGLLRDRGRRVAVLAVDPSSSRSGGALLGDRVRMQDHHHDDGVFVRSMAARGHLGGLAAAAPLAVLVLDAAGYDDVLVETVGVGQSEVEVVTAADVTVLVLAPGMGDGIQAAKAGILEVPDVVVINKADHGGAGRLESELVAAFDLDADADPDERPTIVRCVAVRGEGVDDVLAAIEARRAAARGGDDGRGAARARAAVLGIVSEAFRHGVTALPADGGPGSLLDEVAGRVQRRDLDPFAAADLLLERWRTRG